MRRLLLGLALVSVVVPLAACGGGSSAESTAAASGQGSQPTRSLSAVAVAAKRTQGAGTYRSSLNMSMSIAGRKLTSSGEEVTDNKKQRSRATLELPDLGGQLETISDGTTIYMRSPGLPSGGKWVRLDLEELAGQTGVDLGSLNEWSVDSGQYLTYLRAAGPITRVGTEIVRGVDTTHYKGSIDLTKLPEGASEKAQQTFEKFIDETGVDAMPYEAWIDGDGLLRKFTIQMTSPKQDFSFTATMELYDFGLNVLIPLPPADQIVDFSEIGP